MVVNLPGQDQLIGAMLRDQRFQLAFHRLRTAHGRDAQCVVDPLAQARADLGIDVAHRGRKLAGAASTQTGESLLHGGPQIGALLIRFGGKDVHRQHETRFGAGFGWFEIPAIDRRGLFQGVRREMRGKGIGQPEMGRQLRTIERGAEDPDRHIRPLPRMGADRCAGIGRTQIGHQLGHVIGELIARAHAPAHGAHHRLIPARRAAQPQIDPVAMNRRKRAELFGNGQGRMVGQHHPTRADADLFRVIRHMPQQNRGRRRGDAGHIMMLRHPKPVIALGLGQLCQSDGIGDGGGGVRPFGHGRKIKN